MLPEFDWIVICPECLVPVWTDYAKEVGRVEHQFKKTDGDYENADQLEYGHSPNPDGYLIALSDSSLPDEDKAYIRLRLWRLWNDGRRDCPEDHEPLKNYEIENLESLLRILKGSDVNEIVTRAEINRELGRFEEAKNLLDWPDKSSDGTRIAYIRKLVNNKDSYVREFAKDR